MRLTLAVALVAGGCSFSGPSGTREATPVDAAPEIDAAPDPDAGPDAATPDVDCGGPAVFVDDFEEIGDVWNELRTGDVDISGNALRVEPSTQALAGVQARQLFDLTGDAAAIDVVNHFDPGDQALGRFALVRNGMSFIRYTFSGDDLTAEVVVGGVAIAAPTVETLDPANHRHLRIREGGSQVVFETSSDGDVWQQFATYGAPPFVGSVRLELAASLTDPGASSGPRLEIDDVNDGRTQEPWCAVSTFSDDFGDDSLALAWLAATEDPTRCLPTELGGVLSLDQAAATGPMDVCLIGTAAAYDLTGGAITAQVAQVTTKDPNWTGFFELRYNDLRRLAAELNDSEICAVDTVRDSGFDACVTYTNQNFWRFHEAGGVLTLSASTDGVTFAAIDTVAAPAGLDTTELGFGSRTLGMTLAAEFDVLDYSSE